jgi:hypothetical protein
MKLGGYQADNLCFREINHKIMEEKPSLNCLFACEGDFLLGIRKKPEAIWFDVEPDISIPGLIHSTYVYISVITALMRDDLLTVSPLPGNQYSFVLGGGNTQNELLMHYMATGLNHEIILPEIREISALGAAIVAIVSQKDYSILEALRSCMARNSILPSPSLGPVMADARKRYEILRQKLKKTSAE